MAQRNSKKDGNWVPSLIAVSTVDGVTPVAVEADPVTGNLQVDATASLEKDNLPVAGATQAVGVAIVDASGNQITSFGGGSQYTEDVAAAVNPVGTALNLIRADTLSGVTTTDGDNVAARGTDNGELYVRDSLANTSLASIDTQLSGLATDATLNSFIATDDDAASGDNVIVAGQSKSPDGTDPGNVSAENDIARLITDLNRRQYVNTAHPNSQSFHSDGSSALTDTTVAADPGDGFAIFVTDIVFSTGAATACNIFFEEGSTKVLGPWYLEAVAGRGLSVHYTTPKRITASTALTVTTSAAIAQSLDVTYFVAKV